MDKKTYYTGVDISEYQRNIDWSALKASGCNFIIPRTGFGNSHTDKYFHRNINGAKDIGIDIPAVYHFSYAVSADEAVNEANFTCDLVSKANLPKATIIFFDFEYDSARYYNDIKKKKSLPELTPELVQIFTKAFCDRVKANGFKTGVYFNQDYFKNWYNYGSSFDADWVKWLADYEGDPNYDCDIRQKCSDGRIAGITGNVDFDDFFYDYKKNIVVTKTETKKSNEEIAKEVIDGKWGNGSDRINRLTSAGYDYKSVQAIVNTLMKVNNPKKQVTDEIITKVINGLYGNGDVRKTKLENEGYVYKEVQEAVNASLSGQKSVNASKVSPAQSFDDSLSGTYRVNSSLNLRYIPNLLTLSNVVKVLPENSTIQCYGYYTQIAKSKWLLVQAGNVTGFVDSAYVTKV